MLWRLLIAVVLTASACAPRLPGSATGNAVYTVGGPYQRSGQWTYPQERFGGEETGLAVRHTGQRIAADQELWSDSLPLASHPALQLPAVVRVTRFDTGVSLVLKVIDRGPPTNGRVLGLSAHAADLLSIGDRPVAVRVTVDGARSQTLRDEIAGPAQTGMIAAPRTAVLRESLFGTPKLPPEVTSTLSAFQTALPGRAEAGPPLPGQLFVRASTFSQRGPAETQAGRIDALRPVIGRTGTGRAEIFTVRAGPYPDVARADAALDQALRAGVTDARIVVE